MLTGNYHQANQPTGHVYLDILWLVVMGFLGVRAGSDLFNSGRRRIAIFERICKDDIPRLAVTTRGVSPDIFFSFFALLTIHLCLIAKGRGIG